MHTMLRVFFFSLSKSKIQEKNETSNGAREREPLFFLCELMFQTHLRCSRVASILFFSSFFFFLSFVFSTVIVWLGIIWKKRNIVRPEQKKNQTDILWCLLNHTSNQFIAINMRCSMTKNRRFQSVMQQKMLTIDWPFSHSSDTSNKRISLPFGNSIKSLTLFWYFTAAKIAFRKHTQRNYKESHTFIDNLM